MGAHWTRSGGEGDTWGSGYSGASESEEYFGKCFLIMASGVSTNVSAISIENSDFT